jgi:hypothetical protein
MGFIPYPYKPKWGQTRWRITHKCISCGKEHSMDFDKVLYRPFTGKCFECSRSFKKRAKHPNWRGGVYKGVNGYMYTMLPESDPYAGMLNNHGYVKVCRYNMAKFLGRPLTRLETVHHKNKVKTDDRIENLTLFPTSSEHNAFEYSLRVIDDKGRLV